MGKGANGEVDADSCLFAEKLKEDGIPKHPARSRVWSTRTLCPKGSVGSAGLQCSYGTAKGWDLNSHNKR